MDYSEIRQYRIWTKELIIQRVQEWYQSGADLSWRHVCLQLDPPLAAAVYHSRRFNSWSEVLMEAGIDPEQVMRYRKWSRSKVQQALFELAEQGSSLDQDSLVDIDPALLAAIYRHGAGLVEEREAAYNKISTAHLSSGNSYNDTQMTIPAL
ncbi:MAG: hypothetical protein ACYC27_09350 [Armatimonadota bacterium]